MSPSSSPVDDGRVDEHPGPDRKTANRNEHSVESVRPLLCATSDRHRSSAPLLLFMRRGAAGHRPLRQTSYAAVIP